jgi:hypothetical protein
MERKGPAAVPGADSTAARAALALVAATLLAGCSSLDGDTSTTSVFDLEPGVCVLAPSHEDVAVELSEVATVPCEEPHQLEVFALVDFPERSDTDTEQAGSTFPGDALLKDFADGACAEQFAAYVGVDYRDSELFFTYLVPSARSWQAEDDRTVLCLITTTGEDLSQSVAGTGW